MADSRATLVNLSIDIMSTLGRATPALMALLAPLAALLLATSPAPAIASSPRFADIKRCLDDFDGIVWKLAYRPQMSVYSCSTPDYMGNHPYRLPPGSRRLEIIADMTLGAEAANMGGDESYAATQTAVFIHFDALIRQRGYQLIASENGNARTTYSPYTQCMLQRSQMIDGVRKKAPCVNNDPQVELPPIPYVNLARYARQEGEQTHTLVYKMEAGNLWSISIDGLPAGTGKP